MTKTIHTLILAHRGANRLQHENTLAAFEAAAELACDGFETDIQLTQDEIAVLWHDDTLSKLGQADKTVGDLSYQALQQQAHDAGIDLALVEVFWQRFKTPYYVVLEVKNFPWEPLSRHQFKMQLVLALTREVDFKQVWVSSFHLNSLLEAHHIEPNCPLIYNIEPEQLPSEILAVADKYPCLSGFCLPICSLNQTIVSALRERNKTIAVYTCNSEQDIRLALDLSVDVLISDVPDFALQLRAEYET